LEGKKKKTKHLKKMETAYQQAQKTDLLAADSLINLERSDRWLYINAYYRRMQERQQKVLSLGSLQGADGYQPDLLIIPNLAEREMASRKASASYLYSQAETQLAQGTRASAREAFRTLHNLKDNYFPTWEQSAQLLDSAAINGVEHILVEPGPSFSARYLNAQWQRFYRDPAARPAFDVIIRNSGLNVFVGADDVHTNSYTEYKDIEVGYEEKKDTSGKVIERTPIYETISATVTETTITKVADAAVVVTVIDGVNGSLLHETWLTAQHTFCETSYHVQGDSRALSRCLPAGNFSIFAPGYWEMEQQVLNKIDDEFCWFIKSRLWTD
jgi:hypothetical protein